MVARTGVRRFHPLDLLENANRQRDAGTVYREFLTTEGKRGGDIRLPLPPGIVSRVLLCYIRWTPEIGLSQKGPGWETALRRASRRGTVSLYAKVSRFWEGDFTA
jgi:hypothetical protein